MKEEPHTVEDICPKCNGQGWHSGSEAGHGCDGTEQGCSINCPVPVQVQTGCEVCEGKGRILFTEVGKIIPKP